MTVADTDIPKGEGLLDVVIPVKGNAALLMGSPQAASSRFEVVVFEETATVLESLTTSSRRWG